MTNTDEQARRAIAEFLASERERLGTKGITRQTSCYWDGYLSALRVVELRLVLKS